MQDLLIKAILPSLVLFSVDKIENKKMLSMWKTKSSLRSLIIIIGTYWPRLKCKLWLIAYEIGYVEHQKWDIKASDARAEGQQILLVNIKNNAHS